MQTTSLTRGQFIYLSCDYVENPHPIDGPYRANLRSSSARDALATHPARGELPASEST